MHAYELNDIRILEFSVNDAEVSIVSDSSALIGLAMEHRAATNIAAQKKMGEIINSYNFEKLHEVFAPGVKDHDAADDQGPGPEGFIHWFRQFHSAFPDFKIAVEHLV